MYYKKTKLVKKVFHYTIRALKTQLYVKVNATVINILQFSSRILRNKDDQYCYRSVVFSTI